MKRLVLLATLVIAFTMLIPSNISAQNNKKNGKIPLYKTIYPSSFFTINAEYIGGYRPDQTFNPQTPAFGFKAGTMRNVGWYLSAMTNFQFKGTFTTCEANEVLEGNTSTSYFDVLGGITLRYWKPLSFHMGLGYSYRSFNNETIYGQWAHVANHTAQGPAAALGFMLHLGGFVVSAEVLGSYNLQGFNITNYTVDRTRLTFGAKAGLGVCIPYNNRSLFNEQTNTTPAANAEPIFYNQPTEKVEVVENVATPAPAPVHAPAPAPAAAPAPQPAAAPVVKSDVLTVVTLPVSQLNPGGSITICGEVAVEGDEPVTERGICWGTTYYPSVTGTHTSDGSGKGYFTTVISDLQPGTLYYFRAYAGTQSGIRYGNTVSVSIPDAPKAPVAPTQPVQGTNNPPMPQPPVMPVPPVAPQPQMVPQQPVAPQPQAAPQQPETSQQPVAPQQQAAPQQPVAPQPQTAPQQPATSQQPVAPQQQAAPQQPVAPQQQTAPQPQPAPQEQVAPQQQVAPQDSTATQQTTGPEETTPQQPADNEENPETPNN